MYATHRYIIMLKRVWWAALWASWTQSVSHPPSLLILSSHLCLGLPSGLFPQLVQLIIIPTCIWCLTCYMSGSWHSSRFNRPNNIRYREEIIKLLIMQFCPFSSFFLCPKILPQSVLFLIRKIKFHTYKTTERIIIIHISIFILLENTWEHETFWNNW
jgi:hypothetical protein